MRTSYRTFRFPKTIYENVQAATMSFISIREAKLDKEITVEIGHFDEAGTFIASEATTITGSAYELLMSNSPPFAPNKPANEYREDDLWTVLDMMQQEDGTRTTESD